MNKYINFKNFNKSFKDFSRKKPFPYAIVDNFFNKSIAKKLEKEFPNYNDSILHEYKNYCEIKKSLNNWNSFPAVTYKIFTLLNSNKTLKIISKKINKSSLISDYGLNGGGWHLMNKKGRLNPHLDYSIHPKFYAMRKYNLIVFLTNKWLPSWGGELCFYEKNFKNKKLPGNLITKIYPKFNRAVFFDTSKTSWHSVGKIKTKKIRKSIAIYYLIKPENNKTNQRQKALYAPDKKQLNNKKVLNFIRLRSSQKKFSKVYKT